MHFISAEAATSHTLEGRSSAQTSMRVNSKHRRRDCVHHALPKLRLFAKRLLRIGHVSSGNVDTAVIHRHFSVTVVDTFVPAATIEMGNSCVGDLDLNQLMEYRAQERNASFQSLSDVIDIPMVRLSIVNKFISALRVRHQYRYTLFKR